MVSFGLSDEILVNFRRVEDKISPRFDGWVWQQHIELEACWGQIAQGLRDLGWFFWIPSLGNHNPFICSDSLPVSLALFELQLCVTFCGAAVPCRRSVKRLDFAKNLTDRADCVPFQLRFLSFGHALPGVVTGIVVRHGVCHLQKVAGNAVFSVLAFLMAEIMGAFLLTHLWRVLCIAPSLQMPIWKAINPTVIVTTESVITIDGLTTPTVVFKVQLSCPTTESW
jgi:hypothetical protein